jgi:hypothetical protein
MRKPGHLCLDWLELQHEKLNVGSVEIVDALRSGVVAPDKTSRRSATAADAW